MCVLYKKRALYTLFVSADQWSRDVPHLFSPRLTDAAGGAKIPLPTSV